MPKKREIDKYIMQVLQNAPALRFSEIKSRVSNSLKREIENPVIAENLGVLMSQKLVEKIIENGRVKYRLTQQFFIKQAILTLQGLLENAEDQLFLYSFEDADAPFIMCTPRINDEEIATATNDFNNPADIMARRMLEALLTYPQEKREEVGKLLLWAYWAGVQFKISSKEPRCWIEDVNKCGDFARKIKEEMEQRWKETGNEDALHRMLAEDALLQIIGIVKELIQKSNLQEFLRYLFDKKAEVEKLRGEIFKHTGRFPGGGERLLDEFLDFHGLFLSGLAQAGLLPSGRKIGDERFCLRYLTSHEEVWNAFFNLLLDPFEDLSNIKGGVNEAIIMVKYYGDGLRTLCELPYQSRMIIVYLWGYPEVMRLSDRSFLPSFEEWLQALKDGYLDHRSHLFSKDIEQRLLRAYRNVTRGAPPSDERIDIVIWTLRDLYRNHPRGRDPNFYKEILETIKQRRNNLLNGNCSKASLG